MKQQLIEALRETANEINEIDSNFGKYALRKVNALNETSSMKAIIRTGDDLVLMAAKVQDQPLASGKGWMVANV